MIELFIKYADSLSREKILDFLNKESSRFSIDITQDKSLTNRILIEVESEESESFISYSKFKGFKFYET